MKVLQHTRALFATPFRDTPRNRRRWFDFGINLAVMMLLSSLGAGKWAVLVLFYGLWNYYDGATRGGLSDEPPIEETDEPQGKLLQYGVLRHGILGRSYIVGEVTFNRMACAELEDAKVGDFVWIEGTYDDIVIPKTRCTVVRADTAGVTVSMPPVRIAGAA